MKKIKALLYCTKKGGELIYFGYGNREYRCMTKKNQDYIFNVEGFNPNDISHCLNGTIPCECEIEVEEIKKGWGCLIGTRYYRKSSGYPDYELEQKSCLSFDKMNKYLKGTLNEKSGYALHITNLKVFDKPRELSEYYHYDDVRLTKAPQNMMSVYSITEHDDYVENNYCGSYEEFEEYVLISIQPQWLCKILNGEKDIEIRKQVLNCMKGE